MNRTDAIDAAIAEIDREMHAVDAKRRGLLYAQGGGLEGLKELTELQGKLSALHACRGGLVDLRDAAVAHDRADALEAKKGEILQHVSDGYASMEKRAEVGTKIDSAIVALGQMLREVQALNDEASQHFSAAMRLTPAEQSTKGNVRSNIGEFLSGRAFGVALASKLRAHGVGEVGIVADVIWNGAGAEEDVAEAMAWGKHKVETIFSNFLSACIEGHPKPEPLPSKLTDEDRRRLKPYSQFTPEEAHAAAMAATGQRREMTIDDFDLAGEDKEGLRGAFDANGRGSARISGQTVQIEPRTARKPKGKA